ncbi:MAG: beta strand repeat-containing protein, partial [Pseudomonadales bacterium]
NGNKPLYADAFGTAGRYDRTTPTSNTTRTIGSQGASRTFTLSPVLQSPLTLSAGDIEVPLWLSRGVSSFAGQRQVQVQLGYAGAANGVIGSDTITIQLGPGTASAQYIPFSVNLASNLVLPANTSLTLRVTNTTSVAGESITVHTFKDGVHPSLISLDADAPLEITALEFLDDSTDNGGTPITVAGPGDTIWVRVTAQDPFGRADITGASVTITDPLANQTTSAMSVPTTQPASTAQRYFEFSQVLTNDLGTWNAAVTVTEGVEGFVTATDNADINVNNLSEDISGSYKIVQNITTSDLGATNEGDTLRYTIELVESGGLTATNVSISDNIPANTTFVPGSLTIDGVAQADPAGTTINLNSLNVPASGTLTIEFDVTIDVPTATATVISNTADITHPNGSPANFQVAAEDVVITGVAAAGIKSLYFENLNTTPILTRVQPGTAGTTDRITIANGASQTITLSPATTGPITIDPADGDIPVVLRADSAGGFSFGNVTVNFGYQVGATVTAIGSVTQFAFLGFGGNAIQTNTYNVPVNAIANVPAGAQFRVTITNAMSQGLRVYSFDSGSNYSTVAFDPDPVINVDDITFWTDTMGAGTEVTNPDPNGVDVDIYARIVVSDPFGDFDIQAPDAAVNPSTIVITDPDAAVTDGGTNTSCTAPCYAYDGEDTSNDPPGNGTRTFYYLIRINSDPPSTRGTWTVQFTANEGLEVGQVSHTRAKGFTTLSQPNLSTSIKTFTNTGDVDPGDTLTYVVTLNNSGGQDADNVLFSDTLQSSPVALTFSSASTTCLDETASPLPNPAHAGGVVTLSNISVDGGGSCTITIAVTVGAGSLV